MIEKTFWSFVALLPAIIVRAIKRGLNTTTYCFRMQEEFFPKPTMGHTYSSSPKVECFQKVLGCIRYTKNCKRPFTLMEALMEKPIEMHSQGLESILWLRSCTRVYLMSAQPWTSPLLGFFSGGCSNRTSFAHVIPGSTFYVCPTFVEAYSLCVFVVVP